MEDIRVIESCKNFDSNKCDAGSVPQKEKVI